MFCTPLQVIKRPHWLLVTLVLVNAAATEVTRLTSFVLWHYLRNPIVHSPNRTSKKTHELQLQALPLFLDRLADPITAVLVSVTVVLIFGKFPSFL